MKALALFSGGLDSMLAIKLISMQGIEVKALHMDIGFGGKVLNEEKLKKRANMAGGDFEVVDAKNPYLQKILFAPKYGYGKHFNPCIDCHGFMFRTALSMLKSEKADFVISGEVIGQRPMSQRSEALKSVEKLAQNDDDLILRPLCAKNLAPTKPELEGWVDREKLLNISGRGRERQLAMAKEFGFSEYETPGGGCLLTLEAFANKIRDFIKYDTLESEDLPLLKFGRHLRLNDGAKLVIGRNEEDNNELTKIKSPKFEQIKLQNIVGPVSLLSKNASENDLNEAVKLVLAYARTQKDTPYEVIFNELSIIQTPHSSKEVAKKYFVV